MSDGGCRAWRGELAVRAMGRADPAVGPALDAHLDGCPACRAELEELRATADAVGLADADRLEAPAAAPALADRIVARVVEETAASRRRRAGRLVAAAAAAAAVVVIALAVTLALGGGDDAGPGRPIELVGPGPADGSAVLVAKPWGTEVTLEVSGLVEGEVYWVWLTAGDGDRVVAGTLTGTDGPATAVLGSALPAEDASRIWMTDADDRVVLDATVG